MRALDCVHPAHEDAHVKAAGIVRQGAYEE